MPAVPLRPAMAPARWGRGGTESGGGDTDCTLSAEHIAAGSNSAVPVRTCNTDSEGGLIAGPNHVCAGRDGGWGHGESRWHGGVHQQLMEVPVVAVTGCQRLQAKG
jgi:hypothetical protein